MGREGKGAEGAGAHPRGGGRGGRERPRIRLYVEADLAAGCPVVLGREALHYLRRVMRARAGDEVALFNGRDGEWRARLDRIEHASLALLPLRRTRAQAPEPDLWLLFAPVKGARLGWLVEKATELGASLLRPVLTARTVVARVPVRRARAIAAEAAEQSRRLTVPEIRDPAPLSTALAGWPAGRPLFVCDETGRGAPIARALALRPASPAAFLVGPEGGFAPSELDRIRELPFAIPVALGPFVLRSETAAVAALACWRALSVASLRGEEDPSFRRPEVRQADPAAGTERGARRP